MPDIQIEKDNKFKKLSSDARNDLAQEIAGWWSKFHSKRKTQLDTAKELMKYVYLNQPDRNRTAQWKSNVKENKIHTTWDAMKAGIWKEVWSNSNQMFDVTGVTKEDEENAKIQKQAVVHSLEKMEAGIQFDSATDFWGVYGDFIYKVDWKTRKKQVKRFNRFNGYQIIDLPLEENANIEALNPMFFNFDVAKFKYGDEESWDKCIKICKRFATVEEIKANPLYKLTKEQELELDSDENTKVTTLKDDDELATMTKYGDSYEVLFVHGDFKYNNVYYKNAVAEVFAGKYLIYFDENPIFINPFVIDFTQRDPETGRGISPLKSILDMSKNKEELINLASDIAKLNACPPQWGSDSFLKEKYKNGVIPYEPGKYLEYENSYQGGFPQTVKFDPSGIADIISVLANDISDTSAVNANTMGNVEQGRRLATDLQLAKAGSDTRTAMKLDYIYKSNLKVIKKVAELLAMFNTEPEILLVKDEGKRVAIEVNNAIRQGNYQYVYEDRNALIDRRAKVNELMEVFTRAAQDPELRPRLDLQEAVKQVVESIGFENVDKYFTEPTMVDEMANFVKQLPEEMQQMLLQQIQPIIQQAQMMLQGGQNAQG